MSTDQAEAVNKQPKMVIGAETVSRRFSNKTKALVAIAFAVVCIVILVVTEVYNHTHHNLAALNNKATTLAVQGNYAQAAQTSINAYNAATTNQEKANQAFRAGMYFFAEHNTKLGEQWYQTTINIDIKEGNTAAANNVQQYLQAQLNLNQPVVRPTIESGPGAL